MERNLLPNRSRVFPLKSNSSPTNVQIDIRPLVEVNKSTSQAEINGGQVVKKATTKHKYY